MSESPTVVLGITVTDDLLDHLAERLQTRMSKQEFTTQGLAEHMGVTPRYVRGMAQRGCPQHRVGKRSIWLLPEVNAWLASR